MFPYTVPNLIIAWTMLFFFVNDTASGKVIDTVIFIIFILIAKKYYELGEYHKAYNYALITNQIDRDIEASWIIFAKSLVKLKQKDMAIKTLKQYLESSHSSSAKILLDEILSGKFK